MNNLPNNVDKNWRDAFQLAGVTPKEKGDISISQFKSTLSLVVTPCSKIKSSRPAGTPDQLYKGKTIQKLFTWGKVAGIQCGVLSDKYGLVLDWEVVKNYDTPPSAITERENERLVKIIQTKIPQNHALVIYSPRPMQTWHWVKRIIKVEGPKLYIRTLPKAGIYNGLLFKE